MVDFKKMAWFQRAYAARYVSEKGSNLDRMVKNIVGLLHGKHSLRVPQEKSLQEHVITVLQEEPNAYTSAKDFVDRFSTFFYLTQEEEAKAREPLRNPTLVEQTYSRLQMLTETQWTREDISKVFNNVLDKYFEAIPGHALDSQRDLAKRRLMEDLRQLVMGSKPGPGMPVCMEILGRYICLIRLHLVKDKSDQSHANGVEKTP